MAQPTATEKQEWVKLIQERIDEKIAALWAGDVGSEERVKGRLTELAIENLGIADEVAVIEAKMAQKAGLEKEIDELGEALGNKLLGKQKYGRRDYDDVKAEIERRGKTMRPELAKTEPTLAAVLILKEERRRLTKTVWLATGTSQIKDLFAGFLAKMEQPLTDMQAKAVALPPAS